MDGRRSRICGPSWLVLRFRNHAPGRGVSTTMHDALQWIATATGVVAAVLVALHAGARITGVGFLIFLVSSLAWTGFGFAEAQYGLVVQNIVLTAINIFGAYRYLIAKKPLAFGRRRSFRANLAKNWIPFFARRFRRAS
ncbi:MAG: hypothetical protein AB7P23_05060 [Amphiplicatus sp.]